MVIREEQRDVQETPGLDNKPQLSAMGMTTGSVRYTDDQQIPSLFGYPVLSEVATGRLEQLDVAEALKIKGVVDVVTAQDVPGQNCCGFVPGDVVRGHKLIRSKVTRLLRCFSGHVPLRRAGPIASEDQEKSRSSRLGAEARHVSHRTAV